MGDETEWLRQRPTGVCVRRIALMKDRERTDKIRIAQIGIKRGQLLGRQQSFVGHGSRRKRTEICSARSDGFCFLAETKEVRFQISGFFHRSKKALLDDGKSFQGTWANNRSIGWHR